MYILEIIGIIAVVVIGGFLIVVATRPNEFRIQRSRTLSAPAPVIFAVLNDFHQWGRWSPWEKLDPGLQRTFEGTASGVGAIYSWKGNKKVGEGRMTILESKPSERLVIKLEFFKPFAATNTTVFTLAPAASGTLMTWTMDGRNNFMGKAFCMFMNMDKMVGTDFEKGLANLDAATQVPAVASS